MRQPDRLQDCRPAHPPSPRRHDFGNRFSVFQIIQYLPHHNASATVGRLAVAYRRIGDDMFAKLDHRRFTLAWAVHFHGNVISPQRAEVKPSRRLEHAGEGSQKSFTFEEAGTSLGFMTDSNLNFWGEIAVPVGVAICFGPALLVWFFAELKASRQEKAARTTQLDGRPH
jgi:hypothetical protein